MKTSSLMVILIIFSIVVLGCAETEITMEKEDAMMEDKAMAKEGEVMEKSGEIS